MTRSRWPWRNCGYIDPDCIEEYIAKKGVRRLSPGTEKNKPSEIIDTVKASACGAGAAAVFPAGIKWATCAKHHGNRYIICNADEGDPGAYMDRSILEGDPHSVIEGMLIAALGIGSGQGYIYVRNEYPLAVKRLLTAIKQAESTGFWAKILRARTSFSTSRFPRERARLSAANPPP
ncbi:MAG: hypothetical protein R2875_15630 [Desulfobacterales bacterium]